MIDIWRFISKSCRYWWIDKVPNHTSTLDHATLDYHHTYATNVSNNMCSWNDDIDSMLLLCLYSTCNDKPIPTALFSWGDTEHIHRRGHIPLT